MQIQKTKFPDVLVIAPRVFKDHRGLFFESYHSERYQALGLPSFVQDNVSHSQKNVVRGLHYQLGRPQGKLVYVTIGHILDVIVDIRVGSPTFGQHTTVALNDENCLQVYVPPGFAHGFAVLSDQAHVTYKCTDFYFPEGERGILWNDPSLQIDWPTQEAALSPKDRQHPLLADVPKHLLPQL